MHAVKRERFTYMREILIIGGSFWRDWKCPGGELDLGWSEGLHNLWS